MINTPNSPKSSPVFWYFYALAILILSLGCVAGDQDTVVGEIGVCGSSLERWSEASGQRGQLGFYHARNAVASNSNPGYYPFNPFVIGGSFNTYYVSHFQTGEAARITRVTTSNPSVIGVIPLNQSNQDFFDIEARHPGEADITIETGLGMIDRIRLVVTDIARVDAYHCCADSSRARYLTNSEIEVPLTYRSSYGEQPIGFGIFPFDISDSSRLEWLGGVPDPNDLHFVTGSRPGTVTLKPQIAGPSLSIELIRPSDVDGISPHWKVDDSSVRYWIVGAVLYEKNAPICAGKYPMRVTTQTPEVCDLVGPDGQGYRVYHFAADETVLVDAFRNDDCKLRFELLDEHERVVLSETSIKNLGDAY